MMTNHITVRPTIQYRLYLYTVLSTCNEVTFPANIYFLLRYVVRNHVVTKVEMCA